MFIAEPSIDNITNYLQGLQFKENEGVFLLIAAQDHPDIEQLRNQLIGRGLVFFGGIFPGILYNNQHYQKGAVLIKLSLEQAPYTLQGLDKPGYSMPDFSVPIRRNRKSTAIVLVDGLLEEVAPFLNKLNNALGLKVNFIGGGAGFPDFHSAPCLFTSEGFFNRGAIVVVVDMSVQLGVNHGWKKLAGPMVATETDNNRLQQLNWESAFTVYCDTLSKAIQKPVTRENIDEYLKIHPLGMYKEGTEDIVREAISITASDAMICLGDVPENSVLYILQGDRDALVKSAKKAAMDGLVAEAFSHVFVVDCISRSDFLQEDFSRELEAVSLQVASKNPRVVPFGILSLGEISSYGRGLLEFFNKTMVVGVLTASVKEVPAVLSKAVHSS